MPNDTNPFPEWLEEVINSPLIVDQSQDGLSYECHGNHWSFAISQSQAEVIAAEDVLNFLFSVMQAREQQIKARSGAINSMIFYCWLDEQASHLCFSLVSAAHQCIPFGAIMEETDDFAKVVELFLNSHYHNGIPLEEFVKDSSNEIEDAEPNSYVLLVATKTLPMKNAVA